MTKDMKPANKIKIGESQQIKSSLSGKYLSVLLIAGLFYVWVRDVLVLIL